MGSKYKIDGVSLDVYCKEHDLNFRTQQNRVREYIKKHPNLSEEDAIKLALSRCGTKYWVLNFGIKIFLQLNIVEEMVKVMIV